MKSFKQFLTEDITSIKSIEDVRKANPEYFSKFGDHLLLRGVKRSELDNSVVGSFPLPGVDNATVTVSRLKVRKDRRPSATDEDASRLMDDWFDDKFGIRPRSEAIFTVGSYHGSVGDAYAFARGYGMPTVVVPLGHFDYIWANDVFYGDLYIAFASLKHQQGDDFTADEDSIAKFLTQGDYVMNDSLDNFPSQESEIMVVCDEYLALSIDVDGYFGSAKDYARLVKAL